MSDSVQPNRWQPTRLPCPWDSPGKNTGVGCHFLLQCMKVKSEREVTQLCRTLRDPMDCSPPGSPAHGISQARVLEWVAIAFSATSLCIAPNSTPLKITSKTLKSKKHMEEPLRPEAADSTKSTKAWKGRTMETVQVQRSLVLVGGREEPGGQRRFLKQWNCNY